MNSFRETINKNDLVDVPLQNRKYTWSNEQRIPTLVKLDRVFCNVDANACFRTHVLHALSTLLSDHCPLLLTNQSGPR
jgi:endonuclease/exonuclease/phosphatase family metal-dependent hydrolase